MRRRDFGASARQFREPVHGVSQQAGRGMIVAVEVFVHPGVAQAEVGA